MAKTRRKQKASRKTKRHRGGAKVYLSVEKNKNNGSIDKQTLELNVGENTTPRQLFESFRKENRNAKAMNAKTNRRKLFRADGVTPRYALKSKELRGAYWPSPVSNWNTPGKIIPGKSYYFEYIEQTPEEKRTNYVNSLTQILQPILNYYRDTYGGAKVIPGSSGTRPDDSVNVKQQFKFEKNPKTPILLIDYAFFEPMRYDFYKYLRFDKDVALSGRLDPTGSIVKVFRKPAGRPFEINPAASDIAATEEVKNAYLKELNRQRAKPSGEELFDQNEMLEICCVKMIIEELEGLVKEGPFFDLLKSYGNRADGSPVFPVYTYQE